MCDIRNSHTLFSKHIQGTKSKKRKLQPISNWIVSITILCDLYTHPQKRCKLLVYSECDSSTGTSFKCDFHPISECCTFRVILLLPGAFYVSLNVCFLPSVLFQNNCVYPEHLIHLSHVQLLISQMPLTAELLLSVYK
jgi:hypothetical protein